MPKDRERALFFFSFFVSLFSEFTRHIYVFVSSYFFPATLYTSRCDIFTRNMVISPGQVYAWLQFVSRGSTLV